MNRHANFNDVRGLDSELDLIIRQTEELTGKIVKDLPPVNQTAEKARFFIKQSDGTWKHYIKLEGEIVEI
jgi:hypothetical protein